jgi:hypothetical protein
MSLKPEQIEQINFINWFHYNYPQYSDDLHHFANERKCSELEGKILKRMGVKKGVSDLFLALPLNGKSGLWIELKVGNNKPSQEQKEFLARKIIRGYDAMCVYGAKTAKEIIITYLKD